MKNLFTKTSKHIILNLLLQTSLLIVSSHSHNKTQRLTETHNINADHVIVILNQTISKINLSSSNLFNHKNHLSPNLTNINRCAFEDCLELLDITISDLKTAIFKLQSPSLGTHHDVNMLLSDAMTNHDTCLDGFMKTDNDNNVETYALTKSLKESVLNISNNLSNSLYMLQKISDNCSEAYEINVEFPSWVSENDQRLLKVPVQETRFNLSVAKDGTGNFTTINAALFAAPNSSQTRFMIYIKGGEYIENVEIEKKKTMIMFVGDGIGKTIIKSNRSYCDGWSTFQSATVGVKGNGFIAKGISFVNNAGPTKHQAVALRSGSHLSAFYRCAFEGYQDTLYVHSAKQFYKECHIFGTVDCIFGNAAVVFQNCSVYARKPILNQKITLTAQGRKHSQQPTGISMIHCRILAASDFIPVKGNFKVYLGRPWRLHSRTVIMKSFLDDLIDPAGWLEWDNDFALGTLYYGEYMNEGPGSNMMNRVKWPGFRQMKTELEAIPFTVGPFINGNLWINSTGIPFDIGL